jgi:hyperosmotically inducible periplasmic protein
MKTGLYIVSFCIFALVVMTCGCGKSDVEIQRLVQEKLNAEGISGITAIAKEGIVTLTGEVDSDAVKAKAENSAGSVDGVKSVVNNITLNAQPLSPSDQALKNKIEESWEKTGCEGAVVEVREGVATVSGTVPDAKYAQCIMVLSQSGAEQQVNNLRKAK